MGTTVVSDKNPEQAYTTTDRPFDFTVFNTEYQQYYSNKPLPDAIATQPCHLRF
jgi:hypothetical protein